MAAVIQRKKILDYIERHGSITAREAFDRCGCNSPRKRISELREKGYPICDRWRQNEEGKRYKEYYLYEYKQQPQRA